MKNPLVSIVIPTYNRKIMLKRLLHSLLRGSYSNIEIIVIDDNSNENIKKMIQDNFKKDTRIKYFKNSKNLFAAGSKNVGLKNAKGIYVAFIDDDNVADKMLIEELVGAMENDVKIGEAGPINYSQKNQNKLIFCRSTRNMWTSKTNHHKSLENYKNLDSWETDDIPNAFIVRKSILVKHKIKFNTNFGIMYEESDFAYKIKNQKYNILMIKSAKIYHDIENEMKNKNYIHHFIDDPRRSFTFARNRIIFHQKYSTNIQNFFILTFWVWFFTFYYIFKFITYKGYERFNFVNKLASVKKYLEGNLEGYKLVLFKNEFN